MIKLSKLSDYAIVVLSRLAGEQGEVLTTSLLSTETGIPEPTVSKVLKLLSKQKIVVSVRGANGGYAMERCPKEVTVTELITALEGPIALTTCLDDTHKDCMIDTLCPLKGGWQKVNNAVKDALDKVMLSDLLIPARPKRRAS
jgi:FeS assembly SUF system regulator